jgi:hypothetical protein
MTGQNAKPPIDKILSDEVRKDLGRTPSFPIEETEIVEELVETPVPEIDDGAETVGKNRGGDPKDGKTPE